jgi:hypothetical protein
MRFSMQINADDYIDNSRCNSFMDDELVNMSTKVLRRLAEELTELIEERETKDDSG